jgi:E3 ubiquitin-protein ligase RNF213
MVSFQGSESCTSDGILKAYEKAKKYLELQRNDIANNLLPVFVFDEIGLAEISKYNPLKVLHSLLEVENREIAFVGISNWRLDASKMNRALYLARPDPDEEDLKFTAFCIYQ